MMTLDELEATLPWGLHDAHVERLTIDWTSAQLTFDVRVKIGEHQETAQRARVTVSGLEYCALEAPRSPAQPTGGLWVQPDEAPIEIEGHPPKPDGCFRHRFFVSDFNSFFYVCGRDAALRWLEDAPRPTGERVYFPGEEIPE